MAAVALAASAVVVVGGMWALDCIPARETCGAPANPPRRSPIASARQAPRPR